MDFVRVINLEEWPQPSELEDYRPKALIRVSDHSPQEVVLVMRWVKDSQEAPSVGGRTIEHQTVAHLQALSPEVAMGMSEALRDAVVSAKRKQLKREQGG